MGHPSYLLAPFLEAHSFLEVHSFREARPFREALPSPEAHPFQVVHPYPYRLQKITHQWKPERSSIVHKSQPMRKEELVFLHTKLSVEWLWARDNIGIAARPPYLGPLVLSCREALEAWVVAACQAVLPYRAGVPCRTAGACRGARPYPGRVVQPCHGGPSLGADRSPHTPLVGAADACCSVGSVWAVAAAAVDFY